MSPSRSHHIPTNTKNRLTERFTYTSVNGLSRRLKVEVDLNDVPHASPSTRTGLGIDDDQLGHLAAGGEYCPIHELDRGSWQRCPHPLAGTTCPRHDTVKDS